MLQVIHEKIHGVFAWLIVIAISITFVLFGIQSYLGGDANGNVQATVNGVKVYERQVERSYERLRRQQQAQLPEGEVLSPEMEKALRKQALEMLVNTEILQQAAKKEGYFVSLIQAEATLNTIPAFQEDGTFSQSLFEQRIASAGYTPLTFINQLKSDILVNQPRVGVVESAFATDKQSEALLNLINQKRSFKYLVINKSGLTLDKSISEKKLKAYYDKHQKDFYTPQMVKLNYIDLSLDKITKDMKISDAEVKAYYEKNKSNFSKPAKWKVAHILVKIPKDSNQETRKQLKEKANAIYKEAKDGANFSALAKSKSQDIVSAKQGGELPWLSAGMVDPAFEQAMLTLKKPGEISKPVQTKYGYSIIKLIKIDPVKVKPFDSVENNIRQSLINMEAQKKFSQDAEILADVTYTNPDSLKEAAKLLKLNIKTTDFLAENSVKDGIFKNKKMIVAAFNPDVLEEGNNSDVIQLEKDHITVLRVADQKPSKLKSFDNVKNTIKDILTEIALQNKAEKIGKELLSAINRKKSVSNIIEKYKLNWETVTDTSRQNRTVLPQVLQEAFSLPIAKLQSNQDTIKGFYLNSGDYALIQLLDVKAASDVALTEEQEKQFNTQLGKAFGQMEYQLYLNYLTNSSNISYQ